MKRHRCCLLVACSLVMWAACTTAASLDSPLLREPFSGQSLTVFAAASLTAAFQEMGREFEAELPGAQVLFNFAGSQQLALQIEQGAQTDLLASADQRHMERLVAANLVPAEGVTIFAHNEMVVILPTANPAGIETLEDLANPGVKLILGGEQVPAGAYARQVLDRMAADPEFGPAFRNAVLRNLISNEENVKQVVAKVRLGEADAGIVYRSDVAPGLADELGQIDIPDRFNVRADYPIAVVSSPSPPSVPPNGGEAGGELAERFLAFVLSPDGQRILERWGLIPAQDGAE
jgi:molybdate transport system substrate-binding protein